jgi:hypothetical protein
MREGFTQSAREREALRNIFSNRLRIA